MPQDVKDAVVAAENRTFWSDNGIDAKGIVRAVFNNASGNATQGASTITQQYIKILYLTQERSYTRKLKEAILSLKLGRQVSKQEILEGYLNTIYFGRGAYGIQAAAQAYFDKSAAELDLKESAALASIINNPSHFDPANGKDSKVALRERYALRARRHGQGRRHQRRRGRAGGAEAAEVRGRGRRRHVRRPEGPRADDGEERAARRSPTTRPASRFTEDEIDGGGLRVTTTFTQKAMAAAEEGVNEVRPEGKEFSDKNLHIGVASVQVDTGAVRGIYAGQDYLESARSTGRSPAGRRGSSVKPFALAAGIKAGFSLKDTFDGNSPFELPRTATRSRTRATTTTARRSTCSRPPRTPSTRRSSTSRCRIPDGPQKVLEMMNAMGIPPNEGPGQARLRLPATTRRARPVPGHRARQRDGQPDQHGQRLRDHRQRRPVPRAVHHREGRRRRTARSSTTTR